MCEKAGKQVRVRFLEFLVGYITLRTVTKMTILPRI